MQQQPRALQVAQELVPEPRAFRGPFDQAGDVGHYKTLLRPDTHHAQIGVQRGERVIGNLGPRIRYCGNESGLAGIGHAEQADIGKHFQFQLEVSLLAWPTRRFLARRTVDGAFEAHVAKAAVAPLGNGDDLTGHQQLEQDLTGFGIAENGAHGHLERDVAARRAKHVGAHAVFAALGLMPTRIAKIYQGIEVGVRHGKHMAATPTVTSIGPTEFLVLLVPERHAAIATVARGNVNVGFVDEFHGESSVQKRLRTLCTPQKTKPRLSGAWTAKKACASGCSSHVDRVLGQRTLDGKRHMAVHQGEQGVVLAHADIRAGVELGAALTHDDGACADQFAAESLHTEHFGLGIAPVSRRAAAFFLCHDISSWLAGRITQQLRRFAVQ